jgi:hypothetical protein
LDVFLHSNWTDVDDATTAWRDRLIEWVVGAHDDCVVFTHFVAINAVIGNATNDDRVTCMRVANTGVATVSNDGGRLALVEAPTEMNTKVN